MNVELAQVTGRDGDVPYNLARTLALIEACASDTELLVLPETYLTGFPTRDNVARLAEPLDGPMLAQVHQAAKARNIAVAVGFALNPGFDLLDGSRLKLQTTLFDDGGAPPQQSVQWEKRFDNNLRLNVRWDSQDQSGCQGCSNQWGDPGVDLRWRVEF